MSHRARSWPEGCRAKWHRGKVPETRRNDEAGEAALGSPYGGDHFRVRAGVSPPRACRPVGRESAGPGPPRPLRRRRQPDGAAPAATAGQLQSYAEREQQAAGLEKFKGGVGIYIGGSAVVLLLLVILLVLLHLT